jgi:hypothetical protein
MREFQEAALIARLCRCAAELYRTVPREGSGIASQAEEIAHAADLDQLASSLESGSESESGDPLRPADIRAVCRLLIDVRRNPGELSPQEARIAREYFPEVEADSIAPLEGLVSFYTGLLTDG